MPIPANKSLYVKVKAEADKKFLAPTSVYKSAWIVAEYKKRGGIYQEDGERRGLVQWFREKWVDLERPKADGKGYEQCGRPKALRKGTYPVCRPSRRINQYTPKTIQELDKEKIKRTLKNKQKVKYRGRVSFNK